MTGFTAVVSGETAITARGALREAAERVLGRLWIDQVPVRLASEDAQLWPASASAEAEGRALCWPGQPGSARAILDRADGLRAQAREDGLTEVALLGGGAPARAADAIVRHSLAVEAAATAEAEKSEEAARARAVPAHGPVLSATGFRPSGGPWATGSPLTVLDGLEPGPLLRLGDDPERLGRTLVVVAGDDPGTDTLRRVLHGMLLALDLSPDEIARRFVTVAAPGGPAAEVAAEAGHAVIEAPAATAFGALSPYALVPAALAGVDIATLLDEAATVLPSLTRPENNPGLVLGAILGGAVRAGRGTAVLGGYSAAFPGLAAWIALLLREAVHGRLLPVVQGGGLPIVPADDLFLVTLDGRPHQDDATVSGPLAAQLVLWEYAAAVAAYLLDLDPLAPPDRAAPPSLDEPAGAPLLVVGDPGRAVEVHTTDQALADALAKPGADADAASDPGPGTGTGPGPGPGKADGLAPVLDALAARVGADEHLAIVAYLDPDEARGQGAQVGRLAALLAARCARPVTVSWGSRYPAFGNDLREKGVYLMVTGNVVRDVPVPDRHHRLGALQLAGALGEARAACGEGRPVVRLHLRNRWAGLARLLDSARGGA
ncbi:hypothetical protein [Actinomadura rubrisoli]|uniref:Glucose-6-phosphate isomerase n=1 Tax=Actinomadura rubrisoli TaxID=2530368 RepID=A0A4R5BC74_9ACTN|nr:hypothetical protein [Actinomadura rubrisoli]TDD81112.1 hypothetical protein E1298_24630 [Actinomadura rubrisoli]